MVAPAAPSSRPESTEKGKMGQTDDYISNGEANNYYSAQDSVAIEIPFSGELDAIKKKKQELNEEFSHLLELKKAIKATLENVKTRLHDVRVEVRENEAADSGVQDAKKIERQMRELEHYHDHTSIPLREEIKLLEDIQKLKKNLRVLQARNRPHDLKKRDLDSLVTQFNSIKVVIKGYDTELDNISKQKKELDSEKQRIQAQKNGRRRSRSHV